MNEVFFRSLEGSATPASLDNPEVIMASLRVAFYSPTERHVVRAILWAYLEEQPVEEWKAITWAFLQATIFRWIEIQLKQFWWTVWYCILGVHRQHGGFEFGSWWQDFCLSCFPGIQSSRMRLEDAVERLINRGFISYTSDTGVRDVRKGVFAPTHALMAHLLQFYPRSGIGGPTAV